MSITGQRIPPCSNVHYFGMKKVFNTTELVSATRKWLSQFNPHKWTLNLEGVWKGPEDPFLWEFLNLVPNISSECENDYATQYGSGACLASNTVRYWTRFDVENGILHRSRVPHPFATSWQLLVILSESIEILPNTVPNLTQIPEDLFFVPCQIQEQELDPYSSFFCLRWENPLKVLDKNVLDGLSVHLKHVAQHRILYNPRAILLKEEFSTQEIDFLFPSDISFIESHRYSYFEEHGDNVTRALPAPTLLQMYRPFVPHPLHDRYKRKVELTPLPLLCSTQIV